MRRIPPLSLPLPNPMASGAYRNHLIPLLKDAEELEDAHRRLRTGKKGRQWGLGALNRAIVVMCFSAWEAYVEALVEEAVEALKPLSSNSTPWPTLKATTLSKIGRFNNPNTENTRALLAETLGLQDVTAYWRWRNSAQKKTRERLTAVARERHKIAHGVNPRPIVNNGYVKQLPGFFRKLGAATDDAVRDHLVQTLNVPKPW